jgi:predicted dehydrogenase
MPSSPPSLAILGCGRAAAAHARTLARLQEPVSWAFASRDPHRASAHAARHGGAALRSYEDALLSGAVDAVVITTPPAAHRDLTLAALAAGKHVIVEKPAFLRLEDFDKVAAAAKAAGRHVLVAENYFYKPLRRRLHALITGGALGDVLLVSVNALKRQDAKGWRADPQLSGGPLLEGGVHWISLMANLGLPIADVDALPAGPRPASLLLTFRYASGAAGTLAYSWHAYAPLRGIRWSSIHGTRGAVGFESNGTLLIARGRRPRIWAPAPTDASGARPMLADFLRALRTDTPAAFTLAHARRDVKLAQRALRR